MMFPLIRPDLECLLSDPDHTRILPVCVRPEDLVLCVSRAYQQFNHPLPPIGAVKSIYYPFYVFRRGDACTLIPAAGLPFRLIRVYQFKVPDAGEDEGYRSDFQRLNPDVHLMTALEKAGTSFSDHPAETLLELVMIPFYVVNVRRGQSNVPVLINGCNADVMLENPPAIHNRHEEFKNRLVATITYVGLVTVITAVWIETQQMAAAFGIAVIAGAGVRWLLLRRFDLS